MVDCKKESIMSKKSKTAVKIIEGTTLLLGAAGIIYLASQYATPSPSPSPGPSPSPSPTPPAPTPPGPEPAPPIPVPPPLVPVYIQLPNSAKTVACGKSGQIVICNLSGEMFEMDDVSSFSWTPLTGNGIWPTVTLDGYIYMVNPAGDLFVRVIGAQGDWTPIPQLGNMIQVSAKVFNEVAVLLQYGDGKRYVCRSNPEGPENGFYLVNCPENPTFVNISSKGKLVTCYADGTAYMQVSAKTWNKMPLPQPVSEVCFDALENLFCLSDKGEVFIIPAKPTANVQYLPPLPLTKHRIVHISAGEHCLACITSGNEIFYSDLSFLD